MSEAAVAFDIDGVFKWGREWSPDGYGALEKLKAKGIRHVFVTNGGGGLSEAAYASGFASKVAGSAEPAAGESTTSQPASEENMILSYSPWRELLAPGLAKKRVLVVGDPQERVLEVVGLYGLEKAVHYADYAKLHSTLNPFRQAKEGHVSHTAVANASTGALNPGPHKPKSSSAHQMDDAEPFAAVLVVCDPYDWFEAIQCVVDVLCSPTPALSEYDPAVPPVPVHFSNPDILWKAQHPAPRFGQGAFKIALRALYKTRLRSLRVPDETHDERVAASFRQWGKPTDATFRFIEARLAAQHTNQHDETPRRFYMVGDNPASDMEGVRRANIYHAAQDSGVKWTGILVQTGVYKQGDDTNGAAAVVPGVKAAVDWILQQEDSLVVLDAA